MTISTNALLRLLELVFIDFFCAGVLAFVVFNIFKGAESESTSLAAYLIGLAVFLFAFKFLRQWEIVKKKNSDPVLKLGA